MTMDTYQATAVENARTAMTIQNALALAELLENETLTDVQMVSIQNALRLYASTTNQVLHITDGGAMYITDNHDLRQATEVTRLN